MGVSCASRGGFDPQVFQGVDGGIADDVPELVGKSKRQHEGDPQSVESSDDAAAQLLQVFHEGHAEHAVFFFVFRVGWRRRRRRKPRRAAHQTGLSDHFHGWCRDNFGVGSRLPGFGRSFSFGRRNSLLIVFHASLCFCTCRLYVVFYVLMDSGAAGSLTADSCLACSAVRGTVPLTGPSLGDTLDSAP